MNMKSVLYAVLRMADKIPLNETAGTCGRRADGAMGIGSREGVACRA
jgi:hypothetical protein